MFAPIKNTITRYKIQLQERTPLQKMIAQRKNARRNARLVNIITK